MLIYRSYTIMKLFIFAIQLLSIVFIQEAYASDVETKSGALLSEKQADINGDEVKDILTVIKTSMGNKLLILEEVKNEKADIVVSVPLSLNQTSFDDIEINKNGGFSIYSGCDTCGGYSSVIEYKVAYRNDEYLVAGYTLSEANRIEASFKICDVNLLTGSADITVNDETERKKGDDRAFSLDELDSDYKPKVCLGM